MTTKGVLVVTVVILAVVVLLYTRVYTIHEGMVRAPDMSLERCDGLTLVLGDPNAYMYDAPVSGICFGLLVEGASITPEQSQRMMGVRYFYTDL